MAGPTMHSKKMELCMRSCVSRRVAKGYRKCLKLNQLGKLEIITKLVNWLTY